MATARSPLSPPMSARRSGAAAAGRPARVRRRGGKGRAAGGQDQGSGAARGRTRRLRHAAAHMAGSSIPASSCGFAGGRGRIRADPLRAQAPRRGGHSCGPPAPPLVSLSIYSATPPATAAPTRHQPATSLRLALALSLKSSPSLRRSGRPSSSLRRRPPDPSPPRPQAQLPLLAPGVSLVAAAGWASTSSLQRRRRRSSSGAPSPPRARRVGGAPANAWPQTQRMASSSSGGILLSMWFG